MERASDFNTKSSIGKFVQKAGFKNLKTINFQRYNLDNHITWFLKDRPAGQKSPLIKTNKKTKLYYEKFLIKNNLTDTLITAAKKR